MLCAALLLQLLPAPAGAVTLTAVNDTLLPLSDSTMPTRMGGELYVPYSVFVSLGVSAMSEGSVLSLRANGEMLSFSLDEGYVYDQHFNSYTSPAYSMNGTVYVPVTLCCGKFGLGYSTFSVAGETVLRVTDGTAQSDSSFAAAKAEEIENAINTYRGIADPSQPGGDASGPSGGSQTQTEPPIPEVEEEPAQKPAGVYLTFYGAPTANTPAVLDALSAAARQAAFFLPVNTASWADDTVRRIVAQGHTPALLLDVDAQTDSAAMVDSLAAANERLTLLTGVSTRIVSNDSGCAALTEAQRNALIAAGYRLWDATLDAGDASQSAARAYATTAQYFTSTSATVVVRLHHSRATAQTVQSLAGYMSRQNIPTLRITLSTTPINGADDVR
nr:polysaccharide deacetylase family protein [uncultured Agathobaculum sp.]